MVFSMVFSMVDDRGPLWFLQLRTHTVHTKRSTDPSCPVTSTDPEPGPGDSIPLHRSFARWRVFKRSDPPRRDRLTNETEETATCATLSAKSAEADWPSWDHPIFGGSFSSKQRSCLGSRQYIISNRFKQNHLNTPGSRQSRRVRSFVRCTLLFLWVAGLEEMLRVRARCVSPAETKIL